MNQLTKTVFYNLNIGDIFKFWLIAIPVTT